MHTQFHTIYNGFRLRYVDFYEAAKTFTLYMQNNERLQGFIYNIKLLSLTLYYFSFNKTYKIYFDDFPEIFHYAVSSKQDTMINPLTSSGAH